ncbi:MAG TPA: toast rack family protein [Bryobacteraceae bacterium]|nr:toast rack family protein [Bryobacteraceae bacterium]
MNRAFVPLSAALVCLSGCVIHTASGPPEHSYQVIERDSAKELNAIIHMGAGNLRIGSGTEKLVRADFDYNVPEWKPEVRYTNGTLNISQPGNHTAHFGNSKYDWDLRFNREVPIDLRVEFGAGEAHLDLGSLDLRRVSVQMGVGTINMDLRGPVKHDYNVDIQGGVGEAIVYLPSDAGISAEASGGIGEIKASGLRHEGSRYFNDALDKAKYTVHLNIQGGVGSIKLVAE